MKRLRVNRAHKCPVCGHDTWCLLGETDAICMRVQSNKPVNFSDGSQGWRHVTGEQPVRRIQVKWEEPDTIDAGLLWSEMREATTSTMILALSRALGVLGSSLVDLGAAWSHEHKAWAFPMRDGKNGIVGIRLRSMDGKKWAVKGSHQGLFIPQGWKRSTLYVCEGPTDTAAALSMGLFAIGRPSCQGCIEPMVTFVRRMEIKQVVIISDNDKHGAGLRGSETLSIHLPVPNSTLILPCKDTRDFYRSGGNSALLDCLLKNVIWRNPDEQQTER